MDIELNTLPPPVRNTLVPRVRVYKEDAKKLKKSLVTFIHSLQSNRPRLLLRLNETSCWRLRALLSSRKNNAVAFSRELKDSQTGPGDSKRPGVWPSTLVFSGFLFLEQIGISTLEDLNRQRQQLEHTSNSVRFALCSF